MTRVFNLVGTLLKTTVNRRFVLIYFPSLLAFGRLLPQDLFVISANSLQMRETFLLHAKRLKLWVVRKKRYTHWFQHSTRFRWLHQKPLQTRQRLGKLFYKRN